jgi:zinc D-Ala-D-Ala carboxypeptidase
LNKSHNMWTPIAIVVIMIALLWIYLTRLKPKGSNTEGVYDAEPQTAQSDIPISYGNTSMASGIYKDEPITMRYFTIDEFDSTGKGEKGTGVNMRVQTLKMLDEARHIAGVPFRINSGFRTKQHNDDLAKNKALKVDPNSAHLRGYAADIHVNNRADQNIKIKALYQAGFRRFGFSETFIHVDNDPSKKEISSWVYDGYKPDFNPIA